MSIDIFRARHCFGSLMLSTITHNYIYPSVNYGSYSYRANLIINI